MAASAAGPGASFRRDLSEWRIVLVAWRLVVLQAAHPVVAAGMAEHSTYRGHPWRRVEHTMASGRRLFQADEEQLWREVQRLDRAHRRIGGTTGDGRGYDARDPDARAWVLLTLFESVVAMRELSGDPYPAEELEASYREFAGVAAVFGLSSGSCPPPRPSCAAGSTGRWSSGWSSTGRRATCCTTCWPRRPARAGCASSARWAGGR